MKNNTKERILISENAFLKKWKYDIYDEYEEYIPKLVIKKWIENSDFIPFSQRKVNIFNVKKITIDNTVFYDVSDLEDKYTNKELLRYDILCFFRSMYENSYSPEEYFDITSEITNIGNKYGENFKTFSFDDAIDISIILGYSEAKAMKRLQMGSLIIVDKVIDNELPRYILDPVKLNSGKYLIQPF